MTSNYENGRLVLSSSTPGTLLRVFDSHLRAVAGGRDSLSADLEPGVYLVEGRLGETSATELITVLPAQEQYRDLSVEFAAAAPTPGTWTSRESHGYFAGELSRELVRGVGPDAGLVLVLRNLAGRDRHPMFTSTVSLLDQSLHLVSEWSSDWITEPNFDDISGRVGRLEAGPYVLRVQRLDENGPSGSTDQTIWLSPGWQTLAFLPNGPEGPDPRGMSVHMAPLEVAWDANDRVALAVEAALAGLRDGVPSVSADLVQLLRESGFNNPMLGIIGMHALMVGNTPDRELLEIVVQNLIRHLPDHPDVQALAVLLPDAPHQSVDWPPMLSSSFRRCLLKADLADPSVLPAGSPSERVAPHLLSQGPWLQWTTTEEILSYPQPPSARYSPTLAAEPADVRAPQEARTQVERMVGEMADFNDTDGTVIVDRLGTAELARRAQLPETLIKAALRDLGIERPVAVSAH